MPVRREDGSRPGRWSRRRRRRFVRRLAAPLALLALTAGALAGAAQGEDEHHGPVVAAAWEDDTVAWLPGPGARGAAASTPALPRTVTPVKWRRSRSVGLPHAGHLVDGVQLPASGRDYVTWDMHRKQAPNRAWRRFGNDRLIRLLLDVSREWRKANPGAPRLLIADLSRPDGGEFGRRYGGLGHASHQSGLDVDILYPRLDGREVAPSSPGDVDMRLAQDLVNRLVRRGAVYVFVGPTVRLHGPGGVVKPLTYHDDHLHLRISDPRPAPKKG